MNNTKIKIAATGLSGLVGTRIQELLHESFEFISLSQEDVDITNRQSVISAIDGIDFDFFLHLAAYTDVDGAEKNPELARLVNRDGTRHIFEAVKKKQKKCIYISTDFVFDGTAGNYDETSTPNPQSVYGLTKYEGEQVFEGEGLISRISYPYRANFEPKKDFVRSIIALLQNKTPLTGVADQILTFTFIDDIAHTIGNMCKNFSPGIVHVVGKNSMSGYDAMRLIAQTFSLDGNLIAQTSYDEFYKGRAKRPKNGTITSVRNTFYPMKTFEEGLAEMKKQIENM